MSVHQDLDRPVPLHPLTWLFEGDAVTVGRADIDSYAVLARDGAGLVRRLAAGATPREAGEWYRQRYGAEADLVDLLESLRALGFVRDESEPAMRPAPSVQSVQSAQPAQSVQPVQPVQPVRWQRLGRALFSPAAWVLFGLLVAAAVAEMIRVPALRPEYHNLVFTEYYSIITVALFFAQIPLILVHESFHALAGRRLGLRSRLRIAHRIYFIVFETAMDGLVSVPRRKRYLPILAGVLADLLMVAVLTLGADLTRQADGGLPLTGRLFLALAFATLLRIVWQFYVYLRTDLYVLFSTMLGCVDLHGASRARLRDILRKLVGRPPVDQTDWHPTDRRVARWYAWFMVAGYAFTLGTLAVVAVPVAFFLVGETVRRLAQGSSWDYVLDAGLLAVLSVSQLTIAAVLATRGWRRRRAARNQRVRNQTVRNQRI